MFQPVQKVYVHRMNIPVHHDNDGEAYTYFRRCYDHNKENKKLPVYARICVFSRICQVMHLRKSHQH